MTGAVNRNFWTCGSFADFVAGAVLGERDFVASTALCEPRSVRFRGRRAAQPFRTSKCRFRGRHLEVTALNLEVQISWQVQHLLNLDVQTS